MFRNVSFLVFGTFLSQLILFSTTPILSRFFSPEDFGLYGVVMSLAALISGVSTCKYELALVKLKKNKISMTTTLLMSMSFCFIFVLCVLFYYVDFIPEWNKELFIFFRENIFNMFFLLCGVSFFNILTYTLHANNNVGSVASSMVLRAVFQALLPLTFMYYFLLPDSLILGALLSYLLSSILMLFYFKGALLKIPNLKWCSYFINKNIDFPKFTLPHFLLDKSRDVLLLFGVSAFYGIEVGGAITVAQRLLSAPTQILSKSLTIFVFKHFNTEKKTKNIFLLYLKVVAIFSLLALGMFLIFSLLSENFIYYLLGEQWVPYSELIVAISIWYFSVFVGSIFSQLPFVYNKNKEFFYCNVAFFILFGCSFFLGPYLKDYVFLYLISSMNFIFILLFLIWMGFLVYRGRYD